MSRDAHRGASWSGGFLTGQIALCIVAAVALSSETVGTADRTSADQATKRVTLGAKLIGRDPVGPGFKEMFTGIGHSIVEGGMFSGENIREFFISQEVGAARDRCAPRRWAHATRERGTNASPHPVIQRTL